MRATWKPHDKPGRLTKRSDLPETVFAYPAQRKEPMTNAAHVRNALARFNQVEGVSDAQRASAFANIKKAAKHFAVDISEKDWQELASKPSKVRSNKGARKKPPARRAAAAKTPTKKVAPKRAARAK
jgi:uncharacterized protein DUF6582